MQKAIRLNILALMVRFALFTFSKKYLTSPRKANHPTLPIEHRATLFSIEQKKELSRICSGSYANSITYFHVLFSSNRVAHHSTELCCLYGMHMCLHPIRGLNFLNYLFSNLHDHVFKTVVRTNAPQGEISQATQLDHTSLPGRRVEPILSGERRISTIRKTTIPSSPAKG